MQKPPPPDLSQRARELQGQAAFRDETREALRWLTARGVPRDEAEDLAQDVLCATLEPSVSGAYTAPPPAHVRRKLRDRLSERARRLVRDALARRAPVGDALPDPAESLSDPEPDETMQLHVLPLDRLTPLQRRVFIYHADAGMMFEHIAKIEQERWARDTCEGATPNRRDYCLSQETARRTYHEARKRLQALMDGDRQRNRAIVPLWRALADQRDPPSEVVDRVVARVCERMGRAPPPSGRRPSERHPGGRPHPWLPTLPPIASVPVAVAAVVGLVVGGQLAGVFRGCQDDPRPVPRPPGVVAASAAASGAPAPGPDPSGGAPSPRSAASAEPLVRAPLPQPSEEYTQRLVQAAQLEGEDPAAALSILLAVRPASRSAGAVALLGRLCRRLRDPRCR